MFTNNELAWYRDYLEDTTLPGTAIIVRDSSGSVNDYGEYVEGTAATGTVSCRLDPYNKQDSSHMAGERDASRNWYRLTLSYDVDIQPDDQLTIGSTTYSIIQLHEGHSHNMVTRLVVAKVE